MDLGSISAAITGLKTATDIAKHLNQIDRGVEVNSKVIELQQVILSLQGNLLQFQGEYAELVGENL